MGALTNFSYIIYLISTLILLINATSSSYKTYFTHFKNSRSKTSSQQQRLLLLSLDGFRHDFIETYNLKNLGSFLKDSTTSLYLNPQFPTESYPNHWSMVTGSNVENHGIIADDFYDPVFKEHFRNSKSDLKWWNSSEPVWSTAVKQGIKTSVYDWPGSDVSFQPQSSVLMNTSNSYHHISKFHGRFRLKIKEAIKSFLRDDMQFISIYHDQPDQIAHKYGINSPEFNVTLEQLDNEFGYLIQRLKENKLYGAKNFNLIITSSQGMVNIRKIVFINEYITEADAEIWSFSQSLIHLKPLIDTNKLLMKLSQIPGISLTLKENLPERLNYKNNNRIGSIIISAIEGIGFMYINNKPFQISNNGQISYIRLGYKQKKQLMIASADRATHGYDKLYPNMRGILIAQGSMFKQNHIYDKSVETTDIYPLICHTLGIKCESRNGSLERVIDYFKPKFTMRSNINSRTYENHLISGGEILSGRFNILLIIALIQFLVHKRYFFNF